ASLERGFGAAAIHAAPEVALRVGLGQLRRELGELRPARLMGRRRQLRRLIGRLVVEKGHRVEAEADAVDLAIDPAAIDRLLAEILDLESLRQILVERQERASPRIFGYVTVIHLNEVRGVAPGSLPRGPGPILAPAQRLAIYGDPRILGAIELVDLEGAVGPLLAAPPIHAKALLLGPRPAAEHDERRYRGAGRQDL